MEKIVQEIQKVLEDNKGDIKELLSNPKEFLEKHGIDFDSEKIHEIVDAVKEKINVEELMEHIDLKEIEEKGEELLGGLSKMFKK